MLAIRFLQNNRSKGLRIKPDVGTVEEVSMKAAVAVQLANELAKMVPVPWDRIQDPRGLVGSLG